MTDAKTTRSALARKVTEISLVHGSFRLRSGQQVTKYFDKYRYEALPSLLREISDAMAELVPGDTEALAGIELGGIPLATMMAQRLGLPMLLVRKERKQYGTEKICEGLPFDGKRICLVEDVITTGGQVAQCARHIRAEGGQADRVVCTILRMEENPPLLTEAGVVALPLFRGSDLPETS